MPPVNAVSSDGKGKMNTATDNTQGAYLAAFPPRRSHLVAAAAIIILVYLCGVTNYWWPTSDSAIYLSLGRSLARGEGYCFNGQASNAVTPGLPVILAGLRMAFGEAVWPANLFLAVCGIGALALAYPCIARLSDRRMSLAVVLCCGLSYVFYLGSHRILTGMPFALLFWAAAYVALRAAGGSAWWLAAVAPLAAAGLLIRAPGVLILGPMAIGLLLDKPAAGSRRKAAVLCATMLAVLAVTIAALYLLGRRAAEETPIYATAVGEITGKAMLARRIGQLGQMGFRLLAATAETFTSQEALWPAAPILLALAGIGAVVQWRRGLRMPAVTAAIYLASMAVLGGPAMIRPRYLLPIQPLVVLMTLEAVIWITIRVHRWRGKAATAKTRLLAATIFTGVVIAANAPRLSRNAFYYSYLSYRGQYYQKVRKGEHAELLQVAAALAERSSPDGPVAADEEESGVLHYLSDRRVVLLPQTPCRTAADANRVAEFVEKTPAAECVAIKTADCAAEYVQSLTAALDARADLERIHKGKGWLVYCRSGQLRTTGR